MSEHDSEDRIFLRGLSTECIIGFVDWERRVPQTVVIDLELPCDCERAARRDLVADTVDYKAVAKRERCRDRRREPLINATLAATRANGRTSPA